MEKDILVEFFVTFRPNTDLEYVSEKIRSIDGLFFFNFQFQENVAISMDANSRKENEVDCFRALRMIPQVDFVRSRLWSFPSDIHKIQ